MRRLLLLVLLWGVAGLPAAPVAGAPTPLQPRPELLVSGAWLAEHLDDPDLRVVDLRPYAHYRAAHVPGAVRLPPDALFTERDGVKGMLPTVEALQATVRRLGIDDDSTVVAYDEDGGLWAARLFFVLDYLGQGNGRLLDGGWPLWARHGHPASLAVPEVPPGDFTAAPQPEVLVTLPWVRDHLDDPDVALLDARRPIEYHGAIRYARRGGHIPGAVNLAWTEHLRDDGTLRPAADLLPLLRGLGVVPERTVVVYCQVLARAAHSYFVLRWLGYPDVRGYDGSWAEWGNRTDVPVANDTAYRGPLGMRSGAMLPVAGLRP